MRTLEEKVDEFSAIIILKALKLLREPTFGEGAAIDSLGYWSSFGNAWVSRNGCYCPLERLEAILWRRCEALRVEADLLKAYLAETRSPEEDQSFSLLTFDEKLQRFRRVANISNKSV
jgi:hypothetical protein